MRRRPPGSTRTDTLFPYTTLFRSLLVDTVAQSVAQAGGRPLVAVAPRLPYQGGLSDPYVTAPLRAAASAADVWFDFCFPYHRSEEHTSELQSLMRISYAVFCLKKKRH